MKRKCVERVEVGYKSGEICDANLGGGDREAGMVLNDAAFDLRTDWSAGE